MEVKTIRVIHPRLGPVIINLTDYLQAPDKYKLPSQVKPAEVKTEAPKPAPKPEPSKEAVKAEDPKPEASKPAPKAEPPKPEEKAKPAA